MNFIQPNDVALSRALESWQWLGLAGKRPILVTAFADIFLEGPDGIWFLDSSQAGKMKRVCANREELDRILSSEDERDYYLLEPFVDRANREGVCLGADECYDFRLHPRLGGRVEFENVEKRSFVVTLHIRGQLHEQIRHMKPGTKISKVVLADDTKAKPWWKLW